MLDNRIRTFLALCTNMNYRKTAEQMNLTQPAVTQHIHFLENYYGCKLFTYDRHTLRLTHEAEILKQYAENMIYQENRLAENIKMPHAITLNIGATKTIGEYVIAEHVSEFIGSPENNIVVTVENTHELLEKLKNGQLDFALIEGNFDKNQFAWKKYKTEPFVGVCSKQHSFAGRTVTMEEVIGQTLIVREEGSGTRKLFESLLEAENMSYSMFSKVICVNNFGLMTGLLSKGGITFAYNAVSQSSPMLTSFSVDGWNASHDFTYVFLDNQDSREAVEYFDRYRI